MFGTQSSDWTRKDRRRGGEDKDKYEEEDNNQQWLRNHKSRCQTISASRSKKHITPTFAPPFATTSTSTRRTTQTSIDKTSQTGSPSELPVSSSPFKTTPSTLFYGLSDLATPDDESNSLFQLSCTAPLCPRKVPLRCPSSSPSAILSNPSSRSASNLPTPMSLLPPRPSQSLSVASLSKGQPFSSTSPSSTLSWRPPRTGPLRTA